MSALRILAVSAVVSYAVVCFAMFAGQRRLLYFASYTRVPASSTNFALTSGGATLRGWVIRPRASDPIIYFGGNAENVFDNYDDYARRFPSHSVYLLAYRGYGASDGEPSEAALFADALAEFDHVAALHPGRPIAVIGRSLGSGVASYLACRRPVAKLVLVTPYDSVASVAQHMYLWLPVSILARERFESVSYLQRYHGPLLILRADDDTVIPPASTDRLVASLDRDAVVVRFPHRGHGDISDDPAYGPALSHFIDGTK